MHSYADFDAFSIAPPVGGFEMVLTGPEAGRWRDTWCRLPRSALVFGFDGGANVGHARIPATMMVFRLALSGQPPICAGRTLDRHSLAIHGPGSHLFEAIQGPSAWVNFAVDPALIEESRAERHRPSPVVVPGERRVLPIGRPAIDAIRRALARVRRSVRHAPSALHDPIASGMLQGDVVRAMLAALDGAPAREPVGAAEARHVQILIEAMEFLGATKTHAVMLPELCAAIRTSARTLTRVFHDAFRISPARYLRLRRLGQVRAHLRRGSPRPESVTAAALRFGFSELGRFAVEYRHLFGESPSFTLKKRQAQGEPSPRPSA